MATMKVSNEEVIAKAKAMIKAIQYDRHKEECNAYAGIIAEYDAYNPWFHKKPVLTNIVDTADYLLKREYNDTFGYWRFTGKYKGYPYSGLYDSQHETCMKLRCMAEHNEDDYLMITREEAEQLGIC